MTPPTVLDLVRAALTAGGYDGLYNVAGECGCETDDLDPCGHLGPECCAGYRAPCGDHCDHGYQVSPGDWHIGARKVQP